MGLILFGLGSTAEVMHYHLTRAGHEVVAFTVDSRHQTTDELLDCPVVPFEAIEKHFSPTAHQMMICIGYAQVNQLRAERFAQAQQKGYSLISHTSPDAKVWEGLILKPNCRIGDFSLVQPFSSVEENVYIGSNCVIGHHSHIAEHCFLAARVTLGGGVIIEPYAFIGTGAILRNKVRIGAHSVVGAGAVILQDTEPHSVYMAHPATRIPIHSGELSPG